MGKGLIIGIVIVVALVIGVYYFYSEECTKAGEISMNDVTGEFKECCEGLIEIDAIPNSWAPDECEEALNMEGWGAICSDCGNNNCEEWENKCNCPADCE